MTTLAVLRERAPGERRVAVVPETVGRFRSIGLDVAVETGAGSAAGFTDEAYQKAGARVASLGELYDRAEVLAVVGPPPEPGAGPLRPGQVLVGLLEPARQPDLVRDWAARGVTAVSLDLLPRTLSRAQAMDALSSQASIAGYKAVLVAADTYGRYFPMLTTAAGTTAPANVLVLGAGVAGMAAIATARRLGAVVTGFDIRPQARADVASLGARPLELPAVTAGEGTGGYARALTAGEMERLRRELDPHVARHDVVIATAQVPGRRPPVLVSARALAEMGPGSVVVDLAVGALGGNVEGSRPNRTAVLDNGVTVIGAGSLPARMAPAASTAYARNLAALLAHLCRDGAIHIDLDDEIQAAVVVTHRGGLVNPDVAALIRGDGRPDPTNSRTP
jgi:NAD(P) transhydrogenase subunit alpha